MTLCMVGLEPYRERYTMQLDGPNGWWDRNLKRAGISYRRILGSLTDDPHEVQPIEHGVVLDPTRRSTWGFAQTLDLIDLATEGRITDDDVLYFSDIWHPGFEMIPYTFHQLGIKPKMYAFCHAQSVDEYDFTHPMRWWMRHFERGIANALDGIFVSCPLMKETLAKGLEVVGCSPREKIHACGHVWSTEEVMERMPVWYQNAVAHPGLDPMKPRKNQVVFSSRWDKEKNPDFFMDVANLVLQRMPSAKFVVCTSAPKLRSNDEKALKRLRWHQEIGTIEVRENLTKEEYYAILCESKIQFNCSNQDWVSYVLLEASAAGCWPIYPNFRSFPETFLTPGGDAGEDYRFLYEHLNVEDAAELILDVLGHDNRWTREEIKERSWIHRRFDTTWLRMLQIMNIPVDGFTSLDKDWFKDPFKAEDWL